MTRSKTPTSTYSKLSSESNHHDTGYKELFSHPELVQQLIEGFAPAEVAELMDFSTLKLETGHYITPLFEEKHEDLVWSVQAHWEGQTQTIYLYLLLEFQSSIDTTMPLRLMHYVACFYSHLLKTRKTTPTKGLPPVFPLVLYNGLRRWQVPLDIRQMIKPRLPDLLSAFQPGLRYYLVDEGAYTDEQLQARSTSVSGIFAIEKASSNKEQMQQAVDRIVQIIQQEPNKERIDKVITRWLKRHFFRLGDTQNWERIHSLIEDHAMIAENLQTWAQKERAEGIEQGIEQGYQKARAEAEARLLEEKQTTAKNLLAMNMMNDAQIAQATGLDKEAIHALRQSMTQH